MSRPGIDSFRYSASSPGATRRPPGPPPPPPPFPSQAQAQLIDNAGETFQTVADFILNLPHPRYWPGLLLTYFFLDPLRALIANVIALVTSPRTHRVVLRLSILTALFWTAVVLAILAYIGFYRAWVPEVGRVEELFLQYGNQGQVPYAEVDLSRWRGLGKSMPTGDDWFAEEQEYEAAVELLVPISTSNLDLGNFMVSMDLVTSDNITVFRSSRPAILRPTTPTSRFLSQFAQQLSNRPSVASSQMLPIPFTSPSLELMTITLFDRVVLHPSPGSVPFSDPAGSPLQAGGRPRRVTKAIVRVGRPDADRYWTYGGGHGVGGVVMTPGGLQGPEAGGMVLATQNGGAFRSRGELQTVSAGLRFDAKLTGLRYILYTHPLLSFIVFTSLFLAFELISALTLWTIAAVYTSTLPGLEVDLGADTQFVPGPSRRGGRGRRPSYAPSTGTTVTGDESELYQLDDDDGDDTETETERGRGDSADARARARSMASLRARDEAERREAQAAAEEQARRSGRLMTGGAGGGSLDEPMGSPEDLLTPTTYGRRVLGRLDEETEEETDGAGSETTLSREDAAELQHQRRMRQATVATASQSDTPSSQETLTGSEDSRQADDEGGDETEVIGTAGERGGQAATPAQPEGFRRRKAYDDDGDGGEDEGAGGSGSLLGGSATDPSVSGSTSRRSFGATTEASRRTGTTAATQREERDDGDDEDVN